MRATFNPNYHLLFLVEPCHAATDVFCSSYPSQPRNLNFHMPLNSTSKDLSLEITWDPPEYGENTLWGYEAMLSSSGGVEICHRINGMDAKHRNFTFENVIFGRAYTITVLSIPYKTYDMKNSISKKLKVPDRCNYLKRNRMKLPLSCQKVYEITVKEKNCNNGKESIIVWKAPDANYEKIRFDMFSSCTSKFNTSFLEKNATMKSLKDLKIGCKYEVFLTLVQSDEKRCSEPSTIAFTCEKHDLYTTTFTTTVASNNTSGVMTKVRHEESLTVHDKALYSGLAVLLIVFSITFVLYQKRGRSAATRCFKSKSHIAKLPILLTNTNESSENKEVTSVMLLHSGGCEYLHELVLIFAWILNANGLSVRLDLLETLQKEEMGAATYYEKVEREADFVVIFCTEVAASDLPQTKAYNFILEMVKQNIMDGRDRKKYIPVYFEELATVPGTLRCISKKLPETMLSILHKLHGVEAYVLSSDKTLPIRNSVTVPDDSFKNLNICIENLSKTSHPLCLSSNCNKGKASFPCANDPTNSFENLVW